MADSLLSSDFLHLWCQSACHGFEILETRNRVNSDEHLRFRTLRTLAVAFVFNILLGHLYDLVKDKLNYSRRTLKELQCSGLEEENEDKSKGLHRDHREYY